MSERNPYAPPVAPVIDVPPSSEAAAPPFFAVSLLKYTVMSVATFGLYELYWFYKNWKRIKEREAPYILPFWRAVFAIFFCYQCFSRIRAYEHPGVRATRLAAGPLAVCWIILTLQWRLPDPYGWLSTLSFLVMLPVQRRANEVNAAVAPEHDRNSRLTWLNWAWIAAFGALIMLAILGAVLLPDDDGVAQFQS